MTAQHTTNNLKGILSLCAGVALFAMQDTIIKALSGQYAVTEAIVVRAFVSFPVLVALVVHHGGVAQLDTPQWRTLSLRGACLFVSYVTYFMAFPALPLAEAIALFFVVPIFVTLLAGPMLGERISFLAWGAVIVGLAGVLLILRPGSAIFNPAALLSLLAATTYALAMIMARKHGGNIGASVMGFYQNIVYLLAALAIATVFMALQVKPPGHPSIDFLVRDWVVPSFRDMGLMGLCGIIAAFASNFLAQGYRKGAANVVAPFEYLGMVWGSLWGFLIFHEVPRITTFIGMGLIAVAGLLALRASAKQT